MIYPPPPPAQGIIKSITNGLTLALSLMLMPGIAAAQGTASETLPGIECDQPLRSANGKLVFGDDGSARARCEAYRATALNYVRVLKETRDQLRSALGAVPRPLWTGLVSHLVHEDELDEDKISDWTYTSADVSRLNGSGLERTAGFWKTGIMDKTTIAEKWHDGLRARACGVDSSGRPGPGASVIIWLDPDYIRDRWTPRMIQTVAKAHLDKVDPGYALSEQIPDVLTANGEMLDALGQARVISAGLKTCMEADEAIPANTLVMRIPLTYTTERGEITEACIGSDLVGTRVLGWERHNGLYVVPARAILINAQGDTVEHPDREDLLLKQSGTIAHRPVNDPALYASDYPLVNQDQAMFLLKTCRPPEFRDHVVTESCTSEINGTDVKGSRIYTYRVREFQTEDGTVLKPVKRDPKDAGNELGVFLAAGEVHPEWSQEALFCNRIDNDEDLIEEWFGSML